MRCPDCNKFVGLETEIEGSELDFSADDNGLCITATVGVIRMCAECGQELKRMDFDTEEEVEVEQSSSVCQGKHEEPAGEKHEYHVEEQGCEVTETGGGRYAKNYIGFSLEYLITCEREGCNFQQKGSIADQTSASSYEESV